ncbi:MAG: AzlC family ABC transporter permease [Synechococcales bacterium]|nr:AzlC family ABC transporter permease [Synechococcales bacterium]
MGRRSEFFSGIKAISPITLGVVPFGMIAGITAVESGLTGGEAIAMSVLVFAGASQLAGVQLLASGAPLLVIWLTTLMINLRFTMYSASLAPHLRGLSTCHKILLAYMLTDQGYAMCISYYDRTAQASDRPHLTTVEKAWFFGGVATTIWIVWQVSTALGAILGTGIPESWSLDFAIPLIFLGVIVPAIRHRASVAAALTAGAIAIVAHPLPLNLGLIAGSLVGIAAGVGVERWQGKEEP